MPALPVPMYLCLDFPLNTFRQVAKSGIETCSFMRSWCNSPPLGESFGGCKWGRGDCVLVWECGGVREHRVHVYSAAGSTCLIGVDWLVLTCKGMKANAERL